MKYTLSGNLHGVICDDHLMPVANTTIRLYKYNGSQNEATALTAAQAKETFQMLDEKAIKAKEKYLLAETKTDKDGNYSFTIDGDKKKYQGEVVEFDIHYSNVPDYGQKDTKNPKKFKAFQATLNVLQPKWRETNRGLEARWIYRISHRLWCAILALLDIWVICGTVLNCETQQPLVGIEVIAMDDDIITDDELGQATTDGLGHFCIFYRSRDFKKTFLSPIINVETPLFPWGNGPDIYFKFALGGSVFYEESPSRARDADRENVGNCFCVTLCLKDEDGGNGTLPSAFFHIGDNRRYHIVLNIDTANGKTTGKSQAGWNNSAFYSNLLLLGSLNKTLNGQPTEYLFQYAELPSPGSPIPPDGSSAWKNVTKNDIAYTLVGLTPKFVPSGDPMIPFIYQPDLYVIKNSALDPDEIAVAFNGDWIVVPQSATMLTGDLINLISARLTNGSIDMSGLVPGNSSTSVQPLQKNRYFSLKMKRRQAGNISSEQVAGISRPIAIFNTIYENVPQRGSWLPTTSSELGVATLDLAELAASGGCSKITNSLTAKYTAANPNLGNVSLAMSGPGGPHNFDPVVFSTPGEEAHGSSSYVGNVASLPNCAYEVRISAELKLTNGEDQHDNIWDRVLFCK